MNPLVALLLARIEDEGPITFAEYMRVALYHPDHGYYAAGAERTGRKGDFITSPELDPAFGELWADGVEQIWDACGRPSSFDLIEVGPGEGGFLTALLARARGDFARALRTTLVELSPVRRARQRDRLASFEVDWATDITEVGTCDNGCLIANEVLDNQPVHVLRHRAGRVEELHVAARGTGLVEQWRPPSANELEQRATESTLDGDARFEISFEREQLVQRCLDALGRGAAVFIDYGRDRAGDTLVSYSRAGVADLDLDHPGRWDITAHVDWSSVIAASTVVGAQSVGPVKQRDVLVALGAGAYDDDLRARHDQALGRGDGVASIRFLSRRQALRVLLDAGGLGGLDVLVTLKGIAPAPFTRSAKGSPPASTKEKDRPEGRSW